MNNTDYKEFQIGKVLFVLVLPIQILITYFFVAKIGVEEMAIPGFMIFNSIIILIYVLFYGMTTTVSNDCITVLYGIGLIRKKILVKEILSVKSVVNPWYYGMGIRFISSGMLYSIDGTHAVELKFKDSKRVIRIGTKNSTQLKRKITKRMKVRQ